MDQTAVQNPNDILSAITALAGQVAQPVQTPTLPGLNFNVPTDLPEKYQEFLKQAAQSPDIINYYTQLLSYAKGDLNTAISQLENDYQTGVRQTTDTLGNTLKQLGLTFTGEQNQEKNSLNQRGIALTQDPNNPNKTVYAGGGEAGTELGQLNQSQSLRQEAEQRSAQQSIENMGIKRQQGVTSAEQTARNQVMGYQQQESQDIYNRANPMYQNYLSQQQVDAMNASKQQQNQVSGSGNSSAPVLSTAAKTTVSSPVASSTPVKKASPASTSQSNYGYNVGYA